MDSASNAISDGKRRRTYRNSGTQSPSCPELPRLQALSSPSSDKQSPHALPPKLGIKKRKPRSSAVVAAANERARAAGAPPPAPVHYASPPRKSLRPSAIPPSRRASEPRIKAKSEKGNEAEVKRKGLRHFAVRVSRKVEMKVVTTYNEVADELVAEETLLKKTELANNGPGAAALQKKLDKSGTLVDEKNIRRRVYDSLNVLMAMGIIAKEKKLISWQGLEMAQSAGGNGEIAAMKAAIAEKRQVLDEKQRVLQDIQDQHAWTSSVVSRNMDMSRTSESIQDVLSSVDPLLPMHKQFANRLGLPFVIISAGKDTSIELEIDKAREEIRFTFNDPFQIFDEKEIMKRMSMTPPPPSPTKLDLNEFERISNELMAMPSEVDLL